MIAVADVMRHQAVAVRERARLAEIVSAMRRFHVSSLPVVDAEDRVIGQIVDDDVLLGGEPRESCAPRDRIVGRLDRWFRRAVRPTRYGGRERLATDLMSSPAVTVTGAMPAREAARAMYRHHVHQLPVVDGVSGRLTGTVTRSDVLAVYERPDEDIRREILYDIIEDTLGMPPDDFDVAVTRGAVTIGGRLERHSAALRLAGAIAHVAGVFTVMDHLTYKVDDVTPAPHARL
ncbi:CBS domain-containing protein [Actinomadura sp. DC4]|uniref:CBS domain-containing protein n=1 Tax=Actinomadura sp. DC4 TaxID=3055069 RepID=UPI0025B1DBE5|nr:CBS domain-containing protein [Actinomadura sp. DC4]MDN3358269.1 CBS domain-containing protein [Actinomadura sp. DC4]